MAQMEQSVPSEIAERYEDAVRLTAYFLWEQDGRPTGREGDYWQRAKDQHERQRTFDELLAASSSSQLS